MITAKKKYNGKNLMMAAAFAGFCTIEESLAYSFFIFLVATKIVFAACGTNISHHYIAFYFFYKVSHVQI